MTPVEKRSVWRLVGLLVIAVVTVQAGTFRRRRETSGHGYPSLENSPSESLRNQADELTNHTAAVIDLVLQNVHRLKNYEERARLERLVTRFKNLVDELQHPHHTGDNQKEERHLATHSEQDSATPNDQTENESFSARAAIRAQAEQLRLLQKKNHHGGPVHALPMKNITEESTQPTLRGATDSSISPLSATEVTEPAPSEPSLTQESTEDDSEADELVMELRQEVPQGDTPAEEDNTYREVPAAENEAQLKTQFAETQQNQIDLYPDQNIKTEAELLPNQETENGGNVPAEIGSETQHSSDNAPTPMRIPWLPRQPIPGEILKPNQRSLIPPQEHGQTDSVGSTSRLHTSNPNYKADQYFPAQPEQSSMLAVPVDEMGIASEADAADHPAPIVMSMDPAARQLDTDVTLLRAVINNLHQMQEVLKRMREAEASRSR